MKVFLVLVLTLFCKSSFSSSDNFLRNFLTKNLTEFAEEEAEPPILLPISYDLQLQLPLSEVAEPEVPLFTARCVIQFDLTTQIGPESAFLSDSTSNRAKLKFDIIMLDHFENVSLVFDGNELEIFNVLLTDDSMELSVDQPVLFSGRYTLTIHRYKGLIGAAIYYRDAGEHAVFGSQLFPNRAPAVFPTFLGATQKSTFSISIIHPKGSQAITSSSPEGLPQNVDTNWQMTTFATTPKIVPGMLCFALLPDEYAKIDSSYTGIPMTIHYNKYRIQASQAKHILQTATQVLAILKDMFSSILPVAKIDLITMNEAAASACFSTIIISEARLLSADYANQVNYLAQYLAKQWIGGLVAVSQGEDMCLQEDLVVFVAAKIVRRMTNDEYFKLAQLAKIMLVENIFEAGESLILEDYPTETEISEKCGLKGVQMLESIESLIGEKTMLSKINELIYNSPKGSFDSHTFYEILNEKVDGDIYVSQLLHFWREHGGLPYMDIDRLGNSIKILQHEGNVTVKNAQNTWERIPLWPLPMQFTEFRLPIQIMLSHAVHLNPVREGHIFANLGFQHFYRVNYDIDTWREIKSILMVNATSYTPRERFQLVSDFCYFYEKRILPEPAASVLRNEFVQLVRLRSEAFPICDASIYQCIAAHEHIRPKHLDKNTAILLRKRIFDSFSNSSEMDCRSGSAHDSLNDLCVKIYEPAQTNASVSSRILGFVIYWSSSTGYFEKEMAEDDRIARLKRIRNQDQLQEFQEENELIKSAKRTREQWDEDEEEEEEFEQPQNSGQTMSKAEAMMAKMGYKQGTGLGKNKQGISEPVALSTQRGRTGLGNTAGKAVARDFNEVWDDAEEQKTVEEHVRWFSQCDDEKRREICELIRDSDDFMVIREKKLKIEDEIEFCNQDILLEMLDAKNVFDLMSDKDLREARTRANPYETIGSAFFQNRAAMKTANMDKIYDWIFSQENTNTFLQKNPLTNTDAINTDRNQDIFYFADVCAGPGGFSEYMLWRKGFYNAKGFGFTLAGKDDFKLNKFRASTACYFEPFYGKHRDGNVMNPENIDSLEEFVMKGTNNVGVHLMMADGGFSVEGKENIQEILSKRLYLCQLLVSLCIVREGGNFFCKLFDIFTPFSVALIYLMRICYEEISLHKPHTSRPANSERYITCKGLRKEYSDVVRDYLKRVNRKMEGMKNQDVLDIEEILPMEYLKEDQAFFDNIVEHNHVLARRQTMYLRKYQSFAKNQGQFDKDQGNLKEECLKYWMVPNRARPKEREDYRSSLNPLEVVGQFTDVFYTNRDFSTRPIAFTSNILNADVPGEFPYGTYRFVRLASSNPTILVSTGNNKFLINSRGEFENLDWFTVRIPEKTILLVERVKESKIDDRRKIQQSSSADVIRIIDAAVLHGDNVSKLIYEERMKAAEKFCESLKLVNRTIRKGWGRMESWQKTDILVTAQHFAVEQLDEIKSNFEIITGRGEIYPIFTENNHSFICEGLRFNRILSQEWKAGWSKSQQEMYAFNKHRGSKIPSEWVKNDCHSSFWDTAIIKEKHADEYRSKLDGFCQVPACIWSWKNMNDEYGPKIILESENEYKGRPTISSIMQIIEKIDLQCGKHKSF
ncbi:unnamed protein product [Caenorhabditis angaria]|uniref:Cap-specific mRNA (nucleoside-2'-O-)-methyltransferase 1 n=1 Tax=Caenorhabditis angaria TaxID=860376 RepID=A0A9P1IAX2_9PELO|nr:unnamed protein product [Caenorhabditis angaria]